MDGPLWRCVQKVWKPEGFAVSLHLQGPGWTDDPAGALLLQRLGPEEAARYDVGAEYALRIVGSESVRVLCDRNG